MALRKIGKKVKHMYHLKGQMGGFENNLPFYLPLKPLGLDVEPRGYS
jgi:hypothetical protein